MWSNCTSALIGSRLHLPEGPLLRRQDVEAEGEVRRAVRDYAGTETLTAVEQHVVDDPRNQPDQPAVVLGSKQDRGKQERWPGERSDGSSVIATTTVAPSRRNPIQT